MHVRHPVWLIAVTRPGSAAFALLFALESIARATLATTIPLQAYALLESGRAVSVAFMAVGAAGLAGSFLIPLLIRRMRRRWVYSLGALCLIVAAILLSLGGRFSLLGGMVVRVFGVACLNITLSLYIMDYIQRGDLVRSEPLRLTMSAGAWTLCPSLGVYLYARYGPLAADGLSAAAAARPARHVLVAPARRQPGDRRRPPGPARPARQHRPLPRPAATAARLADRLRPLGLVGPVLHLRAALHGERAARARWRPPASSRSATRCCS